MFPADVYVGVSVGALFPVPKSWTRTKREQVRAGTIRPMVKPDVDNILKAVLDGLNGVAYEDDKQVVTARASKAYTYGEPMIVVHVWEAKD